MTAQNNKVGRDPWISSDSAPLIQSQSKKLESTLKFSSVAQGSFRLFPRMEIPQPC